MDSSTVKRRFWLNSRMASLWSVSKKRQIWPYLRQIATTETSLFCSRLFTNKTVVIIDIPNRDRPAGDRQASRKVATLGFCFAERKTADRSLGPREGGNRPSKVGWRSDHETDRLFCRGHHRRGAYGPGPCVSRLRGLERSSFFLRRVLTRFVLKYTLRAQAEPSGAHEAVEGGTGHARDLGDGGLGNAQFEEAPDIVLLAIEP